MTKYKVNFEFMMKDSAITDNVFHKDYLDNNGDGFTLEEAENVAFDLRINSLCYFRYINIERM